MHEFLAIHPEIAGALARGEPVVALESTVITHGMPYPDNLSTAYALEAEVRQAGAVPATIAVLDGRIRVGLDDDDLRRLAELGPRARKLSRRDLATALVKGAAGSTTVAATMIGAQLAGIAVFATGGIGGVHRGGGRSFDISADLDELARTEVCVVSGGAKAILDLPATLEMLETLGVPVLGYGTDEFPAFYFRDSGLRVCDRVDGAEEVAQVFQTRLRLGIGGGMLIVNPISEADALPRDEIEAAIETALAGALAAGVTGKELTPFLLARLDALTDGRSRAANIALIRSNARVGADIARAWAAIGHPPSIPARPTVRSRV